MTVRLLVGDCRETLPTLAPGSVQAVVTSPPYYGLRDYGLPPLVWGGDAEHAHEWGAAARGIGHVKGNKVASPASTLSNGDYQFGALSNPLATTHFCPCGAWLGSLGLEPTPDLFVEHLVEVFRHVKRVLRDDGVCFLNLGDSYAGSGKGPTGHNGIGDQIRRQGFDKSDSNRGSQKYSLINGGRPSDGLKPKDLMEMPSRVALALQQPHYLGRVKSEVDRAWLAAMIDGEGCIYIGKQPAGHLSGRNMTPRKQAAYQLGLTVTNLSRSIVDRCAALTGVGSVREVQRKGYDRPGFVWTIGNSNARALLIELYPYLVAKQQQARLAIACPPSGPIADASYEAVKLLHKTDAASFDLAPPKVSDLWEPGWYLRSRIPWLKRNSMPESVTDRPATSVEYVFLLAKSARYFWDADAVRMTTGSEMSWSEYDAKKSAGTWPSGGLTNYAGAHKHDGGKSHPAGRNRRNSDWFFESWQGLLLDEQDDPLALVVNPAPFSGAHFATFPAKLVEPMVKASTRPGDTVLDPFAGAGTVGLVADRLQRNAVLCELKPSYAEMGTERITQDAPMFTEVVA